MPPDLRLFDSHVSFSTVYNQQQLHINCKDLCRPNLHQLQQWKPFSNFIQEWVLNWFKVKCMKRAGHVRVGKWTCLASHVVLLLCTLISRETDSLTFLASYNTFSTCMANCSVSTCLANTFTTLAGASKKLSICLSLAIVGGDQVKLGNLFLLQTCSPRILHEPSGLATLP